MEIVNVTTTAFYHNTEMDLSGGNGSYWEDYYEGSTPPIEIVNRVIYSLVLVLGVLGNGVVIWVTGFKIKKTVSTVWYLNLAVADFLVTAFLPLDITRTALDDHWPFGKFMCQMDFTIFYMNMYASIYTLMVISVDRCVCVVCPVWAQNHRSVRKASCVSLGVWVLALALSSPYLVFRDTRSSVHDEDVILCYYNYAFTDNYTPDMWQLWEFRYGVMIITRFLMGFVVPLTVIVSCYSVIIYRLRNNRSLAGQSGRPLKIIATVIAAFFLCWAPFHIMHLISFVNVLVIESSITLLDVTANGNPITTILALLNSCLNPLLYVFMGQDFKAVFRSSILKVLEKAFAEELPQTNTSTNPGRTTEELSQTNTSTNPGRTTEELPQTNTSTNPGRTSEELPQTNTSTNPGRTTEELSQTNTSTNPGRTTEELSQTNTSTNPGRTSEELPQTNTSTNPGRTSEELPQTNTSTNPGRTTERDSLV